MVGDAYGIQATFTTCMDEYSGKSEPFFVRNGLAPRPLSIAWRVYLEIRSKEMGTFIHGELLSYLTLSRSLVRSASSHPLGVVPRGVRNHHSHYRPNLRSGKLKNPSPTSGGRKPRVRTALPAPCPTESGGGRRPPETGTCESQVAHLARPGQIRRHRSRGSGVPRRTPRATRNGPRIHARYFTLQPSTFTPAPASAGPRCRLDS